eukprot:8790196-Ditylum_brightwellii.AAC.1
MGYEDEEKQAVKEAVNTLRRMKTIQRETLRESENLTLGIIDELMALKEWYTEWSSSMIATSQTIEEVFTESLWDEFLAKREEKAKSMREEVSRLKLEESRIKFEESDDS